MTNVRYTVAQALVKYLSVQFTERDGEQQRLFAGIFGIFGHGNVTGLGQALEEVGEDLTYYRPQNEQAMVHTAAAFAKTKNRLQTFACTTSVGPGATNMVTGAALATVNRLPVLLLPGDVFANRAPNPVLQQLEYPMSQDMSVNDAFRPVSRYWDRIQRPEQLIASLPEAMRVLTDPAETGAVTLALPEDVQAEAYDFPAQMFEPRVWRIRRPVPDGSDLQAAADLIAGATNPLFVCGGGVIYSDAGSELSKFATRHRIPVAETQAGKGALPWNHPWNVGPIGAAGGLAANRLAHNADLVIAIGTRLADFTTSSKTAFQHPNVRVIGINISPFDAYKWNALPLVGDARSTLSAISSLLGSETSIQHSGHREDLVGALKRGWDNAVDSLITPTPDTELTQAQVIGIVNEAAGTDGIVVCAAGGLPGDLLKLWRPIDSKGYHVEYGYSCMGYEIAGGLGVKMAAPDREVFVMVGDGSYLMMHTEIVTSIQEGYKLTIVLIDNGGFRCIRNLQTSSGSPSFGNELRFRDDRSNRLDGPFVPVDFARNAETLGAIAIPVETADQLTTALAAATTTDRTTVICISLHSESGVPSFEGWWDVPIAEESDQPDVQTARLAYEHGLRSQRVVLG
ncbi:MAG: Epi-inositol hydrolase [uncultured Thermomicrobiales bacterium]|uniref:Epi-inositol hydrolase n=1 Tax=uncultured Thermomicrobiales bacterium TaxID=1645740 RepID=A0A6J4UIV3_9BACT|nr:MAG: Epi-inositol hydrolase [uncultured Thermomicrobiales bacterium]